MTKNDLFITHSFNLKIKSSLKINYAAVIEIIKVLPARYYGKITSTYYAAKE